MAKGLLISYAGYPYDPSSLFPDNGLANLAGALIESGHEAVILDFGTVDLIKRLMPKETHIILKEIYEKGQKIKEKKGISTLKKLYFLNKVKSIDRFLTKYQEEAVLLIAEEVADFIRGYKPDFVGFKLWAGDGIVGTIKIAELVKKEFPGLKLFGGGPLVDAAEETMFEVTSVFDAVSYGDGEETIIDIAGHCEGKKPLSEIGNLFYREGARIVKTTEKPIQDLDTMPLPVYDDNIYLSMKGNQKIKIIVFDETRGCPNRCYFCPHVHKSGGKWRVKSPERIVREIKRLIERYDIHAFRYAGSCTPAETLIKVAESILANNLDVVYTSYGHAHTTQEASLGLLKKSGLYALFYGVETGDDRILHEIMNKRAQNRALITAKMKAAVEAGIFTIASIIFPAPGETTASRAKTLALLKDVYTKPEYGSVQVQFAGLFPGTEWFRNPEKFGFRMKNPRTYKRDVMSYKIKPFFPPSFWKPLPYSIDGKPHKKFTRETEDFIRELEANNIYTEIHDVIAMTGKLCGLTPKEYRDRCRMQLFSGDWESIANDAETINHNISRGSEIRANMRRA